MIPSDLIESNFPTVSPIASVEQVAGVMRDNDLHALPVVEERDLKGVVSCEDLVYRGIADGEDWFLSRAEDYMTRDPNVALVTDSISSIRALMRIGRHRWLPVISADKKYLGAIKMSALERGRHHLETLPFAAV